MFEAIRNIKTMDDIRVEKARARYEALLAEKNLNESFHAIERLTILFSNVKRAFTALQQASHLFHRMSNYLSRMFGGAKKKKRDARDEEPVTY